MLDEGLISVLLLSGMFKRKLSKCRTVYLCVAGVLKAKKKSKQLQHAEQLITSAV